MSRTFSRFACYQLSQYSFVKPRVSELGYRLPLTVPYQIEIGSPAHIGPHSGAIDFLVPIKTPILAVADGEVIETVDRYQLPRLVQLFPHYLTTRLFRGQLNYLAIRHVQKKIEEFSFYAHLARNSIQVKIGDRVKVGQKIAETGWSGWLDKPHLHFVIYTENPKQFHKETHESLEPRWQDRS